MHINPDSKAAEDLKTAMANTVERDDIRVVLAGYLGGVTYGDVDVDAGGTKKQMVEYCFKLTSNDGSLDDFVGRMIQLKWAASPARTGMLASAPDFVRPPAQFDFTGAVGRLTTGLTSIIDLLTGGKLSERAIEPIQDNRQNVGELASLLRQLDACKAMHDALHTLQIKGAEWLDLSDDETPDLKLFQAEIMRAVDAARALAATLPESIAQQARHATDVLAEAANQLASATDPSDESAAVARETVRAVLIEEAPHFNEAILSICWQLPIRSLRSVLATLPGDSSPPILRDLADALRCSVLAHGLWQEIDADIYEIEHLLMIPPMDFIVRFADRLQNIVRKIRLLTETDDDSIYEVLRSVRSALTKLEQVLPENGATDAGPAAEALGLVAATMAEFAAAARLRFYSVDTRLKAECSALLSIGQPLNDLRRRLPLVLI